MKPPVTTILLFALTAGLVRAAGSPLALPELRVEWDRAPGVGTPVVPAGGLFAALTPLERVLEKP